MPESRVTPFMQRSRYNGQAMAPPSRMVVARMRNAVGEEEPVMCYTPYGRSPPRSKSQVLKQRGSIPETDELDRSLGLILGKKVGVVLRTVNIMASSTYLKVLHV
jgi:hypothetical protein